MIKNIFNKSAKTYVTIIFLSVLSISYTHSQEINLQELNLKDSVMSYKQTVYFVEKNIDEITKDNRINDETLFVKFNKIGNKTENYYYDSTSKFNGKDSYQYDEKGDLMQITFTDSLNLITGKYIYKYNTKRNKIEFGEYDINEEPVGLEKYELDTNGNIVSTKIYYSEDFLDNIINENLPTMTHFKYDNLGNKVVELYFDISGKLEEKCIFSYNKNHSVSEIHYHDNEDTFSYKITYAYDNMNNIMEINVLLQEPPIVETEILIKDGVEYTETTTYIAVDLHSQMKTSFRYEYDEKGNWVKKIEFEDDVPYTITERKIEYYN